MRNDVWTEIKKRLEPAIFGNVTIKADGFEVYFRREMSRYKSVIMTYVNGWFKGIWTETDKEGKAVYEEGRKFFRPLIIRPKPLFKGKTERKRIEKIMGKNWVKKDMIPRIFHHTPDWPNAKMLVAHLKRTCVDVQIVEGKTVV